MNALTRQQRILERLHARGECPVADLAAACAVSGMTIRRDLDALAAAGKAIRTHGGAAPAGRVVFDFQFLRRAEAHAAAKAAIAAAAAGLVADGQSVLLDSGTTTLAVARALQARRRLTIITTALPVASALQYAGDIDVVLLGGTVRRESPDLGGALTEANLEQLQADYAFIGADAVDAQGNAYNHALDVARMLTKMTAAARRVYVVADSSKLGRTALARFGNVRHWAGLITDRGLPRALARRYRQAGVQLILAPPPTTPAFEHKPQPNKQE
jgi:DeoR/GlpR family transcriptional regulator of sugar metabolism